MRGKEGMTGSLLVTIKAPNTMMPHIFTPCRRVGTRHVKAVTPGCGGGFYKAAVK